MTRTALVVGLMFGLSGLAWADKGGKVPWKKDPKAAMEEARKSGKAMMLYFTSEG